MLFALLVEYGPTPPTEELLQAHRDWLFPRFSEGNFILSGVLDAVDGRPPSAIALFEADSLEAAKDLLDTEPFYRSGACTHRVVPFTARVRAVGMDDRFGEDVRAIPVD
ncbi:YciI family protein [Streptomyces sp. NPDC051320]|uniref:YciI family protein n=1 Tax=Streptomyces sp. NPDC051320 TaxID=3154644 RepID=UPI0034180A1B